MIMWIKILLTILMCLCIGAIYTICGYKVTNLFTDGPAWKPWEQVLFWLFWPIIIPVFFASIIAIFLAAVLISIFILFVICYDLIKSAIKKLSR